MSLTKSILGQASRQVNGLAKLLARSYFLLSRGDYWHFASVYVETAQHCNRRCSYCPQSIAPMPRGFMDDMAFATVVNRLEEYGWDGPVFLSRFGEPLLDPRLPEKVWAMRQVTKHVQIFSNGDRLTLDLAGRLVKSGLELCKLTHHKPYSEGWEERISHVKREFPGKFVVLDPVVPYTLGGLTPDAPSWDSCTLPSWAFIINPNLDISLCCHDYAREVKFGNLHEQTIQEVWNNPAFIAVRRNLRNGIFRHQVCQACAGSEEAKASLRDRLPNLVKLANGPSLANSIIR